MAKQPTAKELALIVAAVVKALSAGPNMGAGYHPKTKAKSIAKAMKIEPKADMSTKEQRKLKLELLTKEVFEAKGFKDVVPNVTVLTYKRWQAQGKTPLAGQQPVWVKAPWMSAKQMGYPMFHISQVA